MTKRSSATICTRTTVWSLSQRRSLPPLARESELLNTSIGNIYVGDYALAYIRVRCRKMRKKPTYVQNVIISRTGLVVENIDVMVLRPLRLYFHEWCYFIIIIIIVATVLDGFDLFVAIWATYIFTFANCVGGEGDSEKIKIKNTFTIIFIVYATKWLNSDIRDFWYRNVFSSFKEFRFIRCYCTTTLLSRSEN